jgi:hypothetical protein
MNNNKGYLAATTIKNYTNIDNSSRVVITGGTGAILLSCLAKSELDNSRKSEKPDHMFCNRV